MHVRQPPVRHVGVLDSGAGPIGHHLGVELLSYLEGLNMEELYAWGLQHSYIHDGYVCWDKQNFQRLRVWQWLADYNLKE